MLVLLPVFLLSAEKAKMPGGPTPGSGEDKIDIWADEIVYEGAKNSFVLTGNVTVIQGDLRVNCDRLEGTLDPQDKSVRRVIAIGNVRIISRDKKAEGQRADYDVQKDLIVLTGTPKKRPQVWLPEGSGSARTITYHRSQDRFVLSGEAEYHGRIKRTAEKGPLVVP